MKTIVAGSRAFSNTDILHRALARITVTQVISGCAKGADTMGEVWAALNNIPVVQMPAEWDKYGKSAGYKRNEQMAQVAEQCIVFWDGQSRGSKHMIDIAQRKGLRTYVCYYNQSRLILLNKPL